VIETSPPQTDPASQGATATFLGAAVMLLAVVVGAFGAHALEGSVPEGDLEIWRTAVRYQAWHGLALFVLPVVAAHSRLRAVTTATVLLTIGIFVFSGSLYAIVLTDIRVFGAITPLGGTALIAGWAALLLGGRRPQ
jgi:uncharacterized membrane protein YgdD (TMEM256/DUF423 family)